MIGSNLVRKLIGSRNSRLIKRMRQEVAKINALEDAMRLLSDEQLRAKTDEFKRRLAEGETLDALLNEAFAVVREASVRVMGMRHYDVQLIGGMVLHQGNIAEMRTGEGKTLMATLPLYLNALTGKGAHIITVNDYLAERDCEWMKPIYEFLGMTTGVIISGLNQEQRKAAYACDIVYGTNNEFGFDYLRDNMAFSLDLRVQRDLNFCVVDEVDSILIDEARTPLIISGVAEDTSKTYLIVNQLVPKLVKQEEEDGPGDYSVDEKAKQVFLTEEGHQHIEELLQEAGLIQENKSLYDIANVSLIHHVNAGLRAHALFHRDVDYIVENNEVVIIDEHTGRKMVGRRWSDGLHQAVEAKEGVKIQNESQTLASITFQNFFRLYNKLSGMTGTADTEAFEFQQIYGLEVVVIPTNKEIVRDDQTDLIYLTIKDKFKAIVEDIKQSIEKGQPVLVGTASIEMSELLSSHLKKEKIEHRVLNAKFPEKEAHIIAQAGYPRAVTIATNMAGRGTDIVLGGNWKVELEDIENPTQEQIAKIKADWAARNEAVLAAGGLRIIGTERHESRRIDNQLRGRAGRQGDPGSSCFYLSIEDNLMRIYAGDRLATILKFVGMQEGDSLESPLLTRTIEKAQRKVEGHNFDIRKQLLEYDDVANDQRKVIYQQRNELMHLNDISGEVAYVLDVVIDSVINAYIPENSMSEQWDIINLQKQLASDFMIHLDLKKMLDEDDKLTAAQISTLVHEEAKRLYAEKEAHLTPELMRPFEKSVMLQSLDSHWREHLQAMDHLRQGIHLRGYAQKNPRQEFKREAFELFKQMLNSIKEEVISGLMTFKVQDPEDVDALEKHRRLAAAHDIQLEHANFDIMNDVTSAEMPSDDFDESKTFVRNMPKVGRNEPCPCGSNKKYKQCHGQLQ